MNEPLPLRVLIVEDSEPDTLLLVRELQRGGYAPSYRRVDTPEAASAALDGQEWDLILADHSMPHFSAPAALELVRDKGLDVPFIIVSGKIGEEDAVAAMRAGAHDYIMKDNLARLVAAISRELREAEVRRERRWAQEELSRSEASLAAAQRIAHLGNWEQDLATGEERWSDEVYRIYGYAPQQFRPTYETFLNCVHPEDREYVRRTVDESLRNRIPYNIEHRVLRPDGAERIVQGQGELVLDDRNAPVRIVGTVQDITERKKAEQQREELLAEVEHALELRNQFLSLASHELKTPVTSIKGFAQILYQRATRQQSSDMLRPLQLMNRQVERLERLIADLLDVSRMETGQIPLEMLPFDLNSVVEEVIGEAAIAARGLTLDYDKQSELLWVRGDSERIRQVLTNLLNNAVKYSGARREITVVSRREGDWGLVSVRDYGIGIPREQQPEVFDLYFRGANAPTDNYGGLGLGLYISRNIIERHGGSIWLESEEGKGSTFSFALPLIEPESD
ncbi:MAG: ATP-binding protein [Chloroflexota bacterium]|nr:ATP-binding protein [Chloroflexota bacterium]